MIFLSILTPTHTGISEFGSNHWIPFAVQAVNTIYRLSEHPDKICADVIKQLAAIIMKQKENETEASEGE